MPTSQAASAQVPAPATITPALLKIHSITPDEYARIEAALGRTPSLTELGIFSVMWSEHCSYKSSRVHLRRLPTRGTRTTGPGSVIQGPGENAGIIDVGDGWACAFKIESHNHPSYIEPYQGAATGVGGILRDIFTMGARPLAVMDSLRFGPLTAPQTFMDGHSERSPQGAVEESLGSSPATAAKELSGTDSSSANTTPDTTDYARNRHTLTGVVHGVGGYGNCFGVPNLGGETRFEPCYSGNPLVNAFALGLVRHDEIFYAKAEGVGNPVFYVGAKTGRDGIHGATMASEEFTEGSEQKRPNVQMGDPFLEKLLLEACLEAMKTGAVLGIQDMGAAGLTCSTCEMGARGHLGVTIELDRVPQRETGMTSYEIMLSESQERMLLVAEKGREAEVVAVFEKWGLDCAEVGIVTADDVMRVYHGGRLEAEIPNPSLTDDAPIYHRPVGTWTPPVPKDPPPHILEALKKPRDYTADLKKLLASPNICSKHWIYEQYDSMVQTNTVQGPGSEAGVIRIKPFSPEGHSERSAQRVVEESRGSAPATAAHTTSSTNPSSRSPLPTTNHQLPTASPQRGLAMALAGNGRWCYLDPKLGAMHAVAEAARKVACTGATPVAATNCLNFGNPEKPEIMAQLSLAIDGIAEACTALDIPITGGNVSLYNETMGTAIYPTPVIGVVGILDDVTKAIPKAFQQAGHKILLLQPTTEAKDAASREAGSSEFAKTIMGEVWGSPPRVNLKGEQALHALLKSLAGRNLIHSASDVGSGGIAITIAKGAIETGIGAYTAIDHLTSKVTPAHLFAETCGDVVVTCQPENFNSICELLDEDGDFFPLEIGETTQRGLVISLGGEPLIDASIADLKDHHHTALESQLTEEVLA